MMILAGGSVVPTGMTEPGLHASVGFCAFAFGVNESVAIRHSRIIEADFKIANPHRHPDV